MNSGSGSGSGGSSMDQAAARRRRPRPSQQQQQHHNEHHNAAAHHQHNAAARQSVLDADGTTATSTGTCSPTSPSRFVASVHHAGQDMNNTTFGGNNCYQGGAAVGGMHVRSVSTESSSGSVPPLTVLPSSSAAAAGMLLDSSPRRGVGVGVGAGGTSKIGSVGGRGASTNISICATTSRKRAILFILVCFLVVWMTTMTLLVAKLASEQGQHQHQGQQQHQHQHQQGKYDVIGGGGTGSSNGDRNGDGGSINGDGGSIGTQSNLPIGGGSGSGSISISNRIVDHGGNDILHGLGALWRKISCGGLCWGRTYSYTDARSGDIAVAALERMPIRGRGGGRDGGEVVDDDSSSSSGGGEGHWPRGPIFYATPSMLPYMAQTSTATISSSSTATAATTATTSTRRAALQAQWQKQGTLDPMLRVTPGEEAAPQDHDREPYVQGDCVPMQPWQTMSFPNCNAFHELNMIGSGRNATVDNDRHGGGRARRGGSGDSSTYKVREDNIDFLGRGWFRAAWKVDSGIHENDPVVLKTLRLEREFYDEYYELHRKDAVAMERLTPSPYVIDIYGYCGQSAINELADFFTGFTNLQAFARQLQGNIDAHMLRLKLQISIMMALGVAHMHEIDGQNNATMVHYDINPKNVAIVKGGKPKLNDFNTVEFLRWDKVKQKRCGFRGRLHEPWWRAPEELIMPRSYAEGKNFSSKAGLVETMEDQPLLDEKIDVWSLGNLLYNMLTGHAARGQARTWRYAQVRHDVLTAKLPWRDTDAFYLNSTQPAIVAMRRAVERCIVKDPKARGSALDVAYEMMDALEDILDGKSGNDGGDDTNGPKSAIISSAVTANTTIGGPSNITSSPEGSAGNKQAPQSKSRNSTRWERHHR
mmetsp:Transcript_30224/g.66464  ORF Transcript_30224/g.66464 Transcript_30224/m.66464 type:complete len:874 (-) Transcript_30224:40-2661(-)